MKSRQYTFNNSTITIKFGNIIESHSEVIANSDDCYITMGGGVSRAILNAGGETIFKGAQKLVPVSLGDVAVTTAGTLIYQNTYFIALPLTRSANYKCSKVI